MVQVYADGKPIYAPFLEGYELLKLKATPSVDKAGTAEFTLPPEHPAYNSFVEYKTVIEILRQGELLFRGRALYPTDDLYRQRTITCEGERCFLRDSILRPYLYQNTPAAIFRDLIAQHNAQVDPFKRFRVGEITVTDDNEYIRLEGGSAETVASVLDKLVARCGGYIIFTTAADGVRVINWYAEIGQHSGQAIEFGENLLDYSSTGANTNLATAILPYGAKNETSGLRTTIETVNSGLDYIQDDAAVARHGFIIQPVYWDDVTKPGNLLTKARQYLDTSKNIVTSLELTAVDLSVLDEGIDTFRVGDWVRVCSAPHGVDSEFQLRERTYDLLNPANDTVILGKDLTTLTGQTTVLEEEAVFRAVELSTKVGLNKYNELDNLVKANSTAIEQTAEKIEQKADRADYDALGRQVSDLSSEISQTATEIRAEVSAIQVGGTNLLRNGGFYQDTDSWTMTQYGSNGTGHQMYVATENRDVPSLWLHAENETGVFGAMQTVEGLKKGAGYILHGYAASRNCGTITVEIRDAHSGTWLVSKRVNITAFGENNLSLYDEFEVAFNTGESTDVNVLLYSNTFGTNAYLFIAQVKLEEGNKATAWTPHPEEFNAGSSITLTKDKVWISTPKFEVEAHREDGTSTSMRFTADALTVDRIDSPSVAPRYTGPEYIYVDPAATSEQIAAGTHFRTLGDALQTVNNRQLAYEVTIHMAGGMTEYGELMVVGLCGEALFITSDSANHATLHGAMRIRRCSAEVEITYLDAIVPSNLSLSPYIVRSCSYVRIADCVISCRQTAFHISRGANVMAENNTLFVEASQAGYVMYGGRAHFQNNIGSGVLVCDAGVMTIAGKVPAGGVGYSNTFEPNNIDSVVPTGADGVPVAPVIITAQYPMLYADTYAAGNVDSWAYPEHKPSDDLYQGYTGQAGRLAGCIWFDNASIQAALSGKTVNQASIRLTSQKYVGRGLAVTVHLRGATTDYTGRSGPPSITTEYGAIGSVEPGITTTLTIPVQAVNDLASGAINALVLYSEDTADMDGRNYSKNYARFDGGTSGDDQTRPLLTVIYEE